MSTITLEQALELGYRAGFISACNWPKPCSQDVDSPSFAIELRSFIEKHTPLTRQPEVSEELAKRAEIVRVDTLRKLAAYGSAGVAERYDMAMRAALTAVWHNRPAQSICQHIVSNREGSSYCRLAESSVQEKV